MYLAYTLLFTLALVSVNRYLHECNAFEFTILCRCYGNEKCIVTKSSADYTFMSYIYLCISLCNRSIKNFIIRKYYGVSKTIALFFVKIKTELIVYVRALISVWRVDKLVHFILIFARHASSPTIFINVGAHLLVP